MAVPETNFVTAPVYRGAGLSGGERAGLSSGELTFQIGNISLLNFELGLINFTNLEEVDWDTIIENNPNYTELFNSVKNSLARVWLKETAKGQNNFLISTNWVALNWEEIESKLPGEPSFIQTVVEDTNSGGELILRPAAIIVLDEKRFISDTVTLIKPYRRNWVNKDQVAEAWRVETDLGYQFIVGLEGYNKILGIREIG